MKLAVLTAIPTPYRDPFWNEVACVEGVELDVYYCSEGKPDRPWQVDWQQRFRGQVLSSVNLLKWVSADASAYWVPGLQRILARQKYDAMLIGGYNHPCMLQTMRGCVRRGQPFYLMCETYQQRTGYLRHLKNAVLQRICDAAAGGMPTGRFASDYLQSYGIPEDRLIRVPNVPDVRALRRQGHELRAEAETVRQRLGIPVGVPVAAFVGRLIPKKRPVMTIRAFAAAAPDDAVLVMVGDGPLLDECRAAAEQLGITDRVLFPGFCQPAEVPSWLATASVFVLPSTETWGVAAIEAVSLGVPVIVSDEVGCYPDLVRSNSCGEVVKAGNEQALSDAVKTALTTPTAPADVLQASDFVISEFAYDQLAEQTCRRIQDTIGSQR